MPYLNRQAVLRAFLQMRLVGVIDWEKHVAPIPDAAGNPIANGDHGAIAIVTANNRYRLDTWSSYVRPPLGRVELKHDGATIGGDVSDDTWAKIAAYIREREGNQPIAAAEPPQAVAPVPPAAPPVDVAIGDWVLYRPRSGEWRGGMEHVPALVTALWPDNYVNLLAVDGNGEMSGAERVPHHAAGDFFSWRVNERTSGLRARVAALEDEIATMREAMNTPSPVEGLKMTLPVKTGPGKRGAA